MALPAATVDARVIGVGAGTVDTGDAWSSLLLEMRGSPGAGGMMVRPFVGRVCGGLWLCHEVTRALRGAGPQSTLLRSCGNRNEIGRQRCTRGRGGCPWVRVDDEADAEARVCVHR